MDSRTTLPAARKHNLIIKELQNETLVYDRDRDEAHCLNITAGLVWKHCDGKTNVEEIAKAVGAETQTVPDDRIVWLALEELAKFSLLTVRPESHAHVAGINRRQLVRRIGVAALALPAIISISAPTAQAQVSCPAAPPLPDDCPCTSSAQCQTGCCRVVAGNQICKAGVGGCIP